MTCIKICGLRRVEDVEYINKYSPEFAGFIRAQKRTRQISHDTMEMLASKLAEDICPVAVFYNNPIEDVIKACHSKKIGAIQLHGNEDYEYVSRVMLEMEKCSNSIEPQEKSNTGHIIKSSMSFRQIPWHRWRRQMLIKAVSVQSEKDLTEYSDFPCDMFLLDNGKGGTGKTFEWTNILNANEILKKPFFLAGGIGIDNARSAIEEVNPFALDISSSVETDGYKDESKIREIISVIRSA